MCAMVYSSRHLDSMRETMPQTVPSSGYSPPCDYSAFEADCFDLSLLPCSSDCEVPLSPINIHHFLAMYTDPTTPPPMFHTNPNEKDFDNFDQFKAMDGDDSNSHTGRPFPFDHHFTKMSTGKATDTDKEAFDQFNTLKSGPATMTNVFANFGDLKSPLGHQEMDQSMASMASMTSMNVFEDYRTLKSPQSGEASTSERKASNAGYQYHSSPAMLTVKEEPNYMMSPCMGNYNSPYAPVSVSPTPSPSSSYASNLSPYPLSPSSQTGIKQEQTLDLQEILEESHFLQESLQTAAKKRDATRTGHDLGQKVSSFCNLLMSTSTEPNPTKELDKLDDERSRDSVPKEDDLMSKSMALGNLLLGCGPSSSGGAVPKQEVASTSNKAGVKLGDHTLLREVLKDTSFQRKFNLRPFNFAGMGGFVDKREAVDGPVAVKMEVEEDETSTKDEMSAGTSEGPKSDTLADFSRDKIEPVLTMAIEQLRKDVDSTCNVLGIAADPVQWTVEDVKAWLLCTLCQYNLPTISMEYFNMDGVGLASLTEEDFQQRAPQSGSTLHAQLEIWKAACQENDMAGLLQWNTTTNSTCSGSSGDISEDDEVESVPSPSVGKPAAAAGPATRAGGSHIHLWQFLKELLSSPQVHGSCIRWLDRTKGVFKIEDSVRVARLWGKRKNRPAMNYDKLSRSIRQYYKKGIMKKTERSQRLVYQFCHPYCL